MNLIPLSTRLQQAQTHMDQHGGGEHALWAFQSFSLSVNDLISAAQGKRVISLTTDIEDNLKKAYQHTLIYKQEQESLWPYQKFSMTISEILESAISYFEPDFTNKVKNTQNQLNNEYIIHQKKYEEYSQKESDNLKIIFNQLLK